MDEHYLILNEHLIFDDMRRHPDGQVRVYDEYGRLISGTWCRQATRDLDRHKADVARLQSKLDAVRALSDHAPYVPMPGDDGVSMYVVDAYRLRTILDRVSEPQT